MYALLAALTMLFPPPDLSNHWRWASASVNQSASNPSPVPSPVVPSPAPTPNPVPTPPAPSPLKPGDDCPACEGGYIPSDGSAKVKCWKCNGDGRVDSGDPILLSNAPIPRILSKPSGDGDQENKRPETPKTASESKETTGGSVSEIPQDPDSKQVCYKPIYSKDGYYIFDPEGKKWVRSAKQPPTYKSVATGHWETRTYKSCNGKRCNTYTKQVWVADKPKRILQDSPPLAAKYPIRGSWWSGCRNWQHLTKGQHAGKFDPAYLQSLSWEELQSLHSDHHEGRTKWQYVNK